MHRHSDYVFAGLGLQCRIHEAQQPRTRKTRDPLTPPFIAKTQLQQQHWQHQTTTTTTTTTSTTTAATTRSRHRNGSQGFFWGLDLENAAPTDKVGLGGVGGGGLLGPFFQKAILLFLVYVCKNGFRVGFGHVGVQKTAVLVALKMALKT